MDLVQDLDQGFQDITKNNTKFVSLVIKVMPRRRLDHVITLRQLHLDSMNSASGFAIVARGPATLETTICYSAIFRGSGTGGVYRGFDSCITATAVVGTDIKVGQLPLE